jgi:hypothetical protein
MQTMQTNAVFDSNEVRMNDLKVWIVIQDPKTKQDVNITGNFDILRAFLSGVGKFEIQTDPAHVDAPSIPTNKPTKTN